MSMNGNNAYKKFADQYKVNQDELNKLGNVTYVDRYLRDSNKLSWKDRNDVIEAIEQSIKRQEAKKEKSKRKLKRSKQQKKAIFTGKLKRRIMALGLSAVALLGGYGLYSQYQQQNEPITLEQALENGENLDSLGIDNNILLEMQDIEKMLEKGNLTNEEIISLAPRISGLQFDMVKTKLSNILGVPENEIKLYTRPIEEGKTRETIKTSNGMYTNKDIFTYKNTIPSELSNYIKEDIGEMQDVMKKIQDGNINREEILEQYGEMIKNTSQLAASQMNVDEKGNITVEYTKVADLNKTSNQTKIASTDQEIDNEEER